MQTLYTRVQADSVIAQTAKEQESVAVQLGDVSAVKETCRWKAVIPHWGLAQQEDSRKKKEKKAQYEAIRIFNIHKCSVCSVPGGSSLITQSHVISRGMTTHRGRTVSRCGERQLDTAVAAAR